MHDVHGITHVVGSSQSSVEDAVQTAVRTASLTVRDLQWFEVAEIRGSVANGEITGFQVSLRLGFRYGSGEPSSG